MEKNQNAVEDGFNTNPGEESPKRVHLFNCDKTYNLDSVEKLFYEIKDDIRKKLSFDTDLLIGKNYFPLSKMSEMCETTIPKLQMDLAVFVVHAHESVLKINGDSLGFGYTRFYRALLKATGENVLIVIGGDDQYSNTNEEERSVISRWARRKISSQFEEQFMDGRKSFIFSWNKKHRAIHEGALLHYFDRSKEGQKFEYQPTISPEVSTEGEESGAENKNMPGEGDDKCQKQEVKDNAGRGAESSSSVENNRQAPEMKDTSQQRPDTEMVEEETKPNFLPSDYVDFEKPADEDFEASCLSIEMSDVINAELEAAANNPEVQVKDNADRGAESSSSVENNRQAPKMKDASQQRPDTEMLEEETKPHSLPSDYLDVEKSADEDFEASCLRVEMSDVINAELEAAANNPGVQPDSPKTEVETLMVKTGLRYGEISDSDNDKVVWNERWKPPDDLLSNIFDKFKNVAEADIEIYRVEKTGVIRIKIIDNTSSSMSSFIYAIIEIVSNTIRWIIDNTWRFVQLAGSSEAELKKKRKKNERQ